MLLNSKISIREGTIEETVNISKKIPEFENPYSQDDYQKRLSGKRCLILIAEYEGKPAGFKVGYEMDEHFYSWMGGVLPDFRRKGIADKLADFQENWCRENGYGKIRIKTRNKHKNMLHFLLKNNYKIVDIIRRKNSAENRIILEKEI